MNKELLGVNKKGHLIDPQQTTIRQVTEEKACIKHPKDRTTLLSDHPLEQVIEDNMLKVEMKQTDGFSRNSFTAQQNTHLNNSIRFADTKAGFITAANGFIFSYILDKINEFAGVGEICIKVGIIFLVASIFFSLWVVAPRFMNSKNKGLVYWEHITNYTKDQYVNIILTEDTKELQRNMIENNYHQAVILTRKFNKLAIGFKLCIGGYILILAGLLFKFI